MSEHVHKESPAIHKEAPPIQAAPSLGEATAQGTMDAGGLTPAKILQMQKTHGNRAVQGMIQMMQKGPAVAQRAVGDPVAASTPAPTGVPVSTPSPVPTQTAAPTQAPVPMPTGAIPSQSPTPTVVPTPTTAAPNQTPAPVPPTLQAPSIPAPAPALTPIQQRTLDLNTEGENQAAALAESEFTYLSQQMKVKINSFLLTNSKTAVLRDAILKEMSAKFKNSIASEPKENVKADALAAFEKNAKGSAIFTTALSSYADIILGEQVQADKKVEIKRDAVEGYKTIKPNIKVELDLQKEKARAVAAKKAREKADNLAKAAEKLAMSSTVEKVKSGDTAFLNGISDGNIATAGADELASRNGKESSLLDDTTVDNVFKKELHAPLKKAVVLKFGVGRSAIRRSKELNKFRQGLKDAAREQANDEIDADLATDSSIVAGKGDNAKAYHAMKAKNKPKTDYAEGAKAEAYKLAKGSVDAVMEAEAEVIVDAAIPAEPTKALIKDAGNSLAYPLAKEAVPDPKKIAAAGLSGAKVKAAALLKEHSETAVAKARSITKGDKPAAQAPGAAGPVPNAAAQVPDAAKNSALLEGVKTKVTSDGVARSAISTVVTADTMGSGLSKLGKLIDISTPDPGDSSSIDVELKIPIAQSGGYFLIGFGGGAEREEGELTVNSELTLGAGFQTFGFDASFRFGAVLEAQGKDSSSAMRLLSYGLYKEVSGVSASAGDYFWSEGGKSGESKHSEAEKWAAMVEEEDMVGENYVDVGGMIKLAMDANIGVAKFSADLAGKALTRYQREAAAAGGASTPVPMPAPTTAGTQAPAATTAAPAPIPAGGSPVPASGPSSRIASQARKVIEASAEVEIAFGKDKVAFGLEGTLTFAGNNRELSLEISGTVPSQSGEETGAFTKVAAKIVTAAMGSGKNLIAKLKSMGEDSEKDKKMRGAGTVLDAGSDALFLDDRFDSVGASLSEQLQGDETVNDTMKSWFTGNAMESSAKEVVSKIGLTNALKLALSFETSWVKGGGMGDWEVALEASQVKTFEADAEIIKVEVEKAKRLGKIGLASKGQGAERKTRLEGGLIGVDRPEAEETA